MEELQNQERVCGDNAYLFLHNVQPMLRDLEGNVMKALRGKAPGGVG